MPVTQIVKKGDGESQRAGRKQRRNPAGDLRREVAIMRDLRHKNIVTLRVRACGCYLLELLRAFDGPGHLSSQLSPRRSSCKLENHKGLLR